MTSFGDFDLPLIDRLLKIIYRPDRIFQFLDDLTETRDCRLWTIGGDRSNSWSIADQAQGIGKQFLAFHPP